MRKFTTRIYTKANYLLNLGRMALSNQRGDFYKMCIRDRQRPWLNYF